MKKTCFVLLCAALVTVAPSAFAADGPALSLEGLLARMIAVFSGFESAEEELDALGQPLGQDAVDQLPPNNNLGTGEMPEIGPAFDPFG